jgi:hypothetical protein
MSERQLTVEFFLGVFVGICGVTIGLLSYSVYFYLYR